MEGGDAGVATWAFCQFALSGDIWWESTRGTRGATPLVNPYPPPTKKTTLFSDLIRPDLILLL